MPAYAPWRVGVGGEQRRAAGSRWQMADVIEFDTRHSGSSRQGEGDLDHRTGRHQDNVRAEWAEWAEGQHCLTTFPCVLAVGAIPSSLAIPDRFHHLGCKGPGWTSQAAAVCRAGRPPAVGPRPRARLAGGTRRRTSATATRMHQCLQAAVPTIGSKPVEQAVVGAWQAPPHHTRASPTANAALSQRGHASSNRRRTCSKRS